VDEVICDFFVGCLDCVMVKIVHEGDGGIWKAKRGWNKVPLVASIRMMRRGKRYLFDVRYEGDGGEYIIPVFREFHPLRNSTTVKLRRASIWVQLVNLVIYSKFGLTYKS
jgi:hypothetical protein